MLIDELKDKYEWQDCYIVGKGPSLQYLTKEMIGEGVVIALNDAIAKIEELDLPNDVYAMMKDVDSEKLCVHPTRYPILLHKHESMDCFPDYFHRIIFDNEKLGLYINDFSALSAIKIGELMGCWKFYFVSFDACTTGDVGVYQGSCTSEFYPLQARVMKEFIKKYDYEWITPTP